MASGAIAASLSKLSELYPFMLISLEGELNISLKSSLGLLGVKGDGLTPFSDSLICF